MEISLGRQVTVFGVLISTNTASAGRWSASLFVRGLSWWMIGKRGGRGSERYVAGIGFG